LDVPAQLAHCALERRRAVGQASAGDRSRPEPLPLQAERVEQRPVPQHVRRPPLEVVPRLPEQEPLKW
jgi:hypothetical protein